MTGFVGQPDLDAFRVGTRVRVISNPVNSDALPAVVEQIDTNHWGPVDSVGTAWESTPWSAVQDAAWEAFKRP